MQYQVLSITALWPDYASRSVASVATVVLRHHASKLIDKGAQDSEAHWRFFEKIEGLKLNLILRKILYFKYVRVKKNMQKTRTKGICDSLDALWGPGQ